MLLTEPLGAFDNLIGCTSAPGVDVAGGELLSEAGCSAGVEDIDHIAHRGIHVAGEAHLQRSIRGRGTAVVIDNHRILFRSIEMGWEVVAALDATAVCAGEVPVVCLSQGDLFQLLGG